MPARPLPFPVLYAGAAIGQPPVVRAFDGDTGAVNFTIQAFERSFTGGVNVASADFNADTFPDLLVGAGWGGGPRVRIFDGKTGLQLDSPVGNFWAYEMGFAGGVNVAAADVTGDGRPDVITAAAADGGPRVRVFDGVTREVVADFWAFEEGFRGGVHLAAGDLTLDGKAEVVVGAGLGGGARVRTFDLSGPEPVLARRFRTDFFAADPAARGGAAVAVGDVNGDTLLDLVTGPSGGTDAARIQVFNGFDGSVMSDFAVLDADTTGVSLGTFYLTDDPYADIVVGSSSGSSNRVQVYNAGTGRLVSGPMADFAPLAAEANGVRIAAANDPGPYMSYGTVSFAPGSIAVGQTFEVSCLVSGYFAPGTPQITGTVTFSAQQVTPTFSKLTIPLGSASLVPATGGMMISRGLATLAVANQSLKAGASYQIKAFYSGDSVYSSGGTMVASLQVIGSPIAPIPDCECQSTGSGEATPAGAGLMAPIPKTAGGTRIADGAVTITRNDFAAADVGGSGWTQAWQWTNAGGYQQSEAGSGATLSQAPHLMQVNGNSSLAIVPAAGTAHVLDSFAGAYHPRHNEKTALTAAGGQFTFTDGRGNATVFYDFSGGTPTGRAGRMISSTTADGTTTTVTSWDGSGRPTEMQRVTGSGGTAVTESLVTTYVTSGANAGLVADATLRRKVGTGSWETVRVAEYTYYVNADNHGRDKHLKLAVVKDGAGTTLDTDYYRYDVAASGTDKPLAFAFGTAAYARLTAALGTSVDSLTDAQVDDYADHSLELDSSKRVTKHVVAGAGCSACTGGQGEYTYSYGSNVVAGEAIVGGSNVWQTKVTETLPDGNTNTYYTNGTGQLMLRVYEEVATGAKWRWYTRYDAAGRAILSAGPSTVTGHDEQYADLVNDQGGNFQYLDDDDGLVAVNEFAAATTATSSTAGDVDGYRKGQSIRHGELGTNVPQSASTYIKRTAGSQDYFHPATTTQYRNDDGTGGQTTSWSYTWQGTTAEIESVTTTLPTVTTAQNGPNTATSTVTVNDSFGRPVWSKDEAGFLSYTEYDTKTGAVVKTIADVEDANTGDFTGLPSGWTTPSGGGLHLITTYEVDHLGRTTKLTAPNGRVDYTVYDDDNFEVRYYPGWNSGTNLPTGPITVSRDDRAGGYTETLTMSATPSVSSGRPTGAESIGSVESLSRSYRNLAGQVTHTDSYFNLSGVTYSTAANLGTLNTNYYRTTTDYGKQAGQVNKQVSAAGTITRTEHDGQGRATSIWVGTDDTPTTGSWSVSNLTGTNMTKVAEYEYDNGGVGDGNVTKVTQFPGGGAANRVTETYYDWRNRSVAVKSGVEGSESTGVNRPIQYLDYDNLNQVTTTRMYDGDAVTITSTGDVPNAPSSSLLRAKSTTSFDELGRAYLSEVYSVDPSSGSVSSDTLETNTWFDLRGQVVKSSSPGGLVQKVAYDGVGRTTTSSTTDGGGDSAYADADDVAGDIVLSQDEMTYDSSGNVLLTVNRQRFHDETGTGALGTPTTGVKARVRYTGMYYDTGDRPTATVDVGTNGGSAWTRPGSVPSRSDTVLVSSMTYDSAGMTHEVTDPRGLVARTLYDDIGRTTKTIENYVDGTVGDDNDKSTEYTYGPAGMTTLTAKLTGGGGQTTEWVYGVSGGSGVMSNDIVGATKWPDPSSGSASSGEQETVTVNALGEPLTMTDRNGTVHTLTRDVLGRVTVDTVTTLGSGVDGSVRRVETAYDGQGNAYLLTSYDATTAGNIVTQVQRQFNGLGQMTREWQSHSGAVNTGSTPSVQYAYSEMPSGANHSRLTSITYPDGYVLTFNYASGLNGDISRLSSLSDAGGTLESYDYLGLGTVVRRSHPQPAVDLTFLGTGPGSGGDQYVGLDSFGRVIDQNWKTSSSSTDRFTYSHDRNGNRTTKGNSVNTAFNESYAYDNLNQLTNFTRGSYTQSWDFDALGNFDSVTTAGTTQSRTHNKQNEITAVSGATTPTFDANGNMTTDETGRQFVYDAWNRLKVVKNSGGTTLKTYTYDALNRRVAEAIPGGATTDLYYSKDWQVLEERDADRTNDTTVRYVWSPVYVDAMILRDRDTADDGTLDERLWVQQDANWNVTALTNSSGTVVERYSYDPFGVVTVMNASWTVIGSSAYGWVHLHQGGRLDATSGLYHFRHRDDSPTLGRWTTMDPIGYDSETPNLFQYLSNDVISSVDPIGLDDYRFLPADRHANPFQSIEANMKPGGRVDQMFRNRIPRVTENPFFYLAEHMVIRPAIRTVTLLPEAAYCMYDPYYQPYNDALREYLNHNKSWGRAVFDATADATTFVGIKPIPTLAATRANARRTCELATDYADLAAVANDFRGAVGVTVCEGRAYGGQSFRQRSLPFTDESVIGANQKCAETVMFNNAASAGERLRGSYSAVAYVNGELHGFLVPACNRGCASAFAREGIIDAVPIATSSWLRFYGPTGSIPTGFAFWRTYMNPQTDSTQVSLD